MAEGLDLGEVFENVAFGHRPLFDLWEERRVDPGACLLGRFVQIDERIEAGVLDLGYTAHDGARVVMGSHRSPAHEELEQGFLAGLRKTNDSNIHGWPPGFVP
jgi:hypothetical protein